MLFPLKTNILFESQLPINSPTQLDEIDELSKDIDANMGKEVIISKDILDSFKLKDNLNPDIWIDGKLNPKLKNKLIQIAKDFFKDLEINKAVKIKDIIFTGSLANFNWSKYSDIDLHVVIDFNQFDATYDIVDDYFYAQKSIWNQEHDIKVFNFPVELFIQDVNHKLVATSIYSVVRDKWITKPNRKEFKLDKAAIKDKADRIIYQLRDIRQDYKDKQYQTVVNKVTKLKDKVKQMRNAGLERGGEFSLENLVFKVLRRTPFMDQLDSYKHKAYDTLMSVSERITENTTLTQGGILLIKGFKGSDGTTRLFATAVKSIIPIQRNLKDNTPSNGAKMAILGNQVYRLIIENDKLMIKSVAWNSNESILKALGLNANNVVINNNKTPMWWDTLECHNFNQLLSKYGENIIHFPKIRWLG